MPRAPRRVSAQAGPGDSGRRPARSDVRLGHANIGICEPLGQTAVSDACADWAVTALNHQHADLRCPDGATLDLQVGNRVGLGISHPCTTFDKWQRMALVDDDYNMCDAIVTSF